MASSAILGIAGAVSAIGASSVYSFAQFEKEMKKATSITLGMTADMEKSLSSLAKTLGSSMPVSATELAKGYYSMASAGLTATQQMADLGQMAKFVVASNMDMTQAVRHSYDIMNAFKMNVDDTAKRQQNLIKVQDALINANRTANATAEEFARGLSRRLAGSLRIMNKDMYEGIGILTAYAQVGIKGETASFAASIALRELQRAAVKNADTWKFLGLEVFDTNGKMRHTADIVDDLTKFLKSLNDEQQTQILLQMGIQQRGQDALRSILGMGDAIRKGEKNAKTGGTTLSVYEERVKTLSAQFEIAKNSVNSFFINLGEGLTNSAAFTTLKSIVGVLSQSIAGLNTSVATSLMNIAFFFGLFKGGMFILNSMKATINQSDDDLKELARRHDNITASIKKSKRAMQSFPNILAKSIERMKEFSPLLEQSSIAINKFYNAVKGKMGAIGKELKSIANPIKSLNKNENIFYVLAKASIPDKFIASVGELSTALLSFKTAAKGLKTFLSNVGISLNKIATELAAVSAALVILNPHLDTHLTLITSLKGTLPAMSKEYANMASSMERMANASARMSSAGRKRGSKAKASEDVYDITPITALSAASQQKRLAAGASFVGSGAYAQKYEKGWRSLFVAPDSFEKSVSVLHGPSASMGGSAAGFFRGITKGSRNLLPSGSAQKLLPFLSGAQLPDMSLLQGVAQNSYMGKLAASGNALSGRKPIITPSPYKIAKVVNLPLEMANKRLKQQFSEIAQQLAPNRGTVTQRIIRQPKSGSIPRWNGQSVHPGRSLGGNFNIPQTQYLSAAKSRFGAFGQAFATFGKTQANQFLNAPLTSAARSGFGAFGQAFSTFGKSMLSTASSGLKSLSLDSVFNKISNLFVVGFVVSLANELINIVGNLDISSIVPGFTKKFGEKTLFGLYTGEGAAENKQNTVNAMAEQQPVALQSAKAIREMASTYNLTDYQKGLVDMSERSRRASFSATTEAGRAAALSELIDIQKTLETQLNSQIVQQQRLNQLKAAGVSYAKEEEKYKLSLLTDGERYLKQEEMLKDIYDTTLNPLKAALQAKGLSVPGTSLELMKSLSKFTPEQLSVMKINPEDFNRIKEAFPLTKSNAEFRAKMEKEASNKINDWTSRLEESQGMLLEGSKRNDYFEQRRVYWLNEANRLIDQGNLLEAERALGRSNAAAGNIQDLSTAQSPARFSEMVQAGTTQAYDQFLRSSTQRAEANDTKENLKYTKESSDTLKKLLTVIKGMDVKELINVFETESI